MSVAEAIRTRDPSVLPSRRDEDWRWSDLKGLIRQVPPPSPEGQAWPWAAAFAVDEERVVVNGRGPADLTLAPGETRVVGWRFLSATPETAHAAEAWISLGAGAKLVLVESHEGAAEGCLSDVAVHVRLAEGATLERILLAEDHPESVSVIHAEVALAPRARLAQTVLTTGARRQRIETRVHHPGHGAAVRLDGAYLLAGRRHADITTVVRHEGVGGETSQLTKGVAADQARAVFQGRIVVAHGADKTDARMRHDALLLSDRAEVDAKPELEIYADDVACAHGNTVGALDEEALFYARARGIPLPDARALLTEAFVAEVVERIEHEPVREAAASWVASRLEATAP